MKLITGSFQYNGATVTVQKPSVMTRIRIWQLRQSLAERGAGDVPLDIADSQCFYLAHTVKVDGELGFPVPIETPTHEALVAFVEGFAVADEGLVTAWDNAIYGLKAATNDGDLLPPSEVIEKKDTPPKSRSKG